MPVPDRLTGQKFVTVIDAGAVIGSGVCRSRTRERTESTANRRLKAEIPEHGDRDEDQYNPDPHGPGCVPDSRASGGSRSPGDLPRT
jgi:hypothetical protein